MDELDNSLKQAVQCVSYQSWPIEPFGGIKAPEGLAEATHSAVDISEEVPKETVGHFGYFG